MSQEKVNKNVSSLGMVQVWIEEIMKINRKQQGFEILEQPDHYWILY